LTKKKEKRKHCIEHRTYANRRLKPHPQTPTSGGMRKYKRSAKPKKKPRSSIKQKWVIKR
jgi:hypothetical protein